ncbi:MAG: hypothetical protein QNJ94_18720 [Alphaproteobacteria bacterium]|nr:hypothetical protein [Alphaproteobacteria bacterium]
MSLIGMQFEALKEFEGTYEFPPGSGTFRKSAYAPGGTYTCRNEGLSEALEGWVEAGNARLLGPAPTGGVSGG